MSRLLSELLIAPEPAFSLGLRKLEQASGGPSADVRLAADITRQSKEVIHELGLDPIDTTGRELYHALMIRTEQDDKRLRKHLGVDDSTPLNKIVPLATRALGELDLPRGAWVLKNSVARRLLRQTPPRHFMKQLGYRSIDSLLKREASACVVAGSLLSEGSGWRERFYGAYKRLKATDYETRDVNMVILDSPKWRKFFRAQPHLKRRLILPVPELGTLIILPLEATVLPGAALALLLSLVYHINKIRSQSVQVKLHQLKPSFGRRAHDIWRGYARPMAFVANQPLYWNVIHRHFADASPLSYPELFEPHIQADDLQNITPEAALIKIDPVFGLWQVARSCGVSYDGLPVSLNAMDAAVNYCNKLDFQQRSWAYVQEALGEELLLRYLRQPKVTNHVLRQLSAETPVEGILLEVAS